MTRSLRSSVLKLRRMQWCNKIIFLQRPGLAPRCATARGAPSQKVVSIGSQGEEQYLTRPRVDYRKVEHDAPEICSDESRWVVRRARTRQAQRQQRKSSRGKGRREAPTQSSPAKKFANRMQSGWERRGLLGRPGTQHQPGGRMLRTRTEWARRGGAKGRRKPISSCAGLGAFRLTASGWRLTIELCTRRPARRSGAVGR